MCDQPTSSPTVYERSQQKAEHPPIGQKWLLWNLFLTQFLIGSLAVVLLWWQERLSGDLFGWSDVRAWLWGIGVGLCVVAVDWILTRWVPTSWVDDGGINEALFRNLSMPMIALIALMVAVAEELLFRGALQYWLGVVGTSLLFVLIHFRYWKRWLLLVLLFGVSLILGWMVEWTGSLASAIAAHFTIDFVMGILIRKGAVSK
ncbi:CPBP family intramembrane glutamic endopeptidase [Desmospora profundinema]|uniref:Membrane protease YdiL (CAAX protease family) n=1 Tax=Desmospora profundinema TaxID=1571184 RepID=A0ABU1IIC9_9BACL|nr:CPBP family intramembrane glutamic endopeptidase [Desmospora profundinema]MDR6224535.1 membrane protease YdiL (CAAX protease family) [Desmospora profundinema]